MADRRAVSLAALAVWNFRAYFAGQLAATTGLWFQNLSVSLVVADLTGSASALALVTVAQFGPVLVLSAPAGRVVDAHPPRRVLMATSAGAATLSLVLAAALAPSEPDLVVVLVVFAALGSVAAFERAAAQAIVFELVGPDLLQNGVVLSTVYLSGARSIGPALAGVAFVALGPAACMIVTACGYAIQLGCMAAIRERRLVDRPRPEGEKISTLRNLGAVAANRPLLAVLLVNVVVTLGAMNFNVVLTSVVSLQFDGAATALGAAHALNAIGAVVGALAVTLVARVRPSTLVPACLVFAVALAVNASMPTLGLLLLAAPVLGIGLGVYQSVLNSAAQSVTPPHALGRTMALLTMGNRGMAPFGALLMGALIDATTGRTALAVGATTCVATATVLHLALRAADHAPAPELR
ncbi:MAG: MFS transporter [Actinomycetota bacterium]|nr:MFS transporter [Actinomycetota bacterium]